MCQGMLSKKGVFQERAFFLGVGSCRDVRPRLSERSNRRRASEAQVVGRFGESLMGKCRPVETWLRRHGNRWSARAVESYACEP